MKRILMIAVASGAVAVPAASSADTSTGYGTATRGDNNLQIELTVRSVEGVPAKIRKFRFENLTAECNVGEPIDVNGHIRKMRIDESREFDGKLEESGGKVVVEGKVNAAGDEVKGTIRATGKLGENSGCDTGKVKWKVSGE